MRKNSVILSTFMRLSILLLSGVLLFSSCSEFTKVQKSTDYEYKLRMADKFYLNEKYNWASQLYAELFPLYKGQPQFEDLFYKYAYSAYNLKDWMNAENLFKQFLDVFPTSPRAEEMEFMRAYTYYRQSPKSDLDQSNTQRTIGLMQTFVNLHPNSERAKQALEVIEICRQKLEDKSYKAAQLYYNMTHYKAAAIAFNSVMEDFPDSEKSDFYKLNIIKSYYKYAEKSIDSRKVERYEKVLLEINDFIDRFENSVYRKEVDEFLTNTQNNIKAFNNEQIKTAD